MTTTLAEKLDVSRPDQYLYLEDVTWDFYESLLVATQDRRVQITYDRGRLELMSPLPRHERVKTTLGSMISVIAIEREIDVDALGSTTFRQKMLDKGLEPDECYYVQNHERVSDKDDLDLDVDPPPYLVIEVEVTSRVIKRLPIYAAMKVPEIWRHDGLRVFGLQLVSGSYQPIESSMAFPFLKVAELNPFLDRCAIVRQTVLLREFRDWVRAMM